jgi:hypothetical protein
MGQRLPATADSGGETVHHGLVAWSDLNMLIFKKSSIYVINLIPQTES